MKSMNYLLLLFLLPVGICWGQSVDVDVNVNVGETSPEKDYKIKAVAELGFLGVFDHKIQFGQNTTYFDLRKDGGQDVLFPVTRLSLELNFKQHNTFILLYQPLKIDSKVALREDVQIDDVLYPMGTTLNVSYGFPFFRASYLRDLKFAGDKFGLALGLSVQIRNADIRFSSGNGSRLQRSSNIGIVPLLKLRAFYQQNENMSLELEADGIYAPVSYLNGSDNEVIGSLLDVSLRQNFQLIPAAKVFLNLRYLGGGAQGVSDDTSQVSDGFSKNWLHFFTVTAGFAYEF